MLTYMFVLTEHKLEQHMQVTKLCGSVPCTPAAYSHFPGRRLDVMTEVSNGVSSVPPSKCNGSTSNQVMATSFHIPSS